MDGMDGVDGVGHTLGMRIAVSLPDDLFASADRFARKSRKTRSQLYAEALAEYLAWHDAEEVTAALDRVCKATGGAYDSAISVAARRALERGEW